MGFGFGVVWFGLGLMQLGICGFKLELIQGRLRVGLQWQVA